MAWLLNGSTLLFFFFWFPDQASCPCRSKKDIKVHWHRHRVLLRWEYFLVQKESTTWVTPFPAHGPSHTRHLMNSYVLKNSILCNSRGRSLARSPVLHTQFSTRAPHPLTNHLPGEQAVFERSTFRRLPKDRFGLNVPKIHHQLQNGDQTPWGSDARLPLMEGRRTILPPPQQTPRRNHATNDGRSVYRPPLTIAAPQNQPRQTPLPHCARTPLTREESKERRKKKRKKRKEKPLHGGFCSAYCSAVRKTAIINLSEQKKKKKKCCHRTVMEKGGNVI